MPAPSTSGGVSGPVVIPESEHQISREDVSPAAERTVATLREAGFSAELVGGCVRDLLLGEVPKDFDVATSASPEDVRRLFRRSRLVGRRFKLAHVRDERETIEVATYRASPHADDDSDELMVSDDGRLLSDNQYGTREEDAVRRDFTVNALYFDTVSGDVIDYVDGMADIVERRLRVIGDPVTRLREDPVRILRAIRFSAKLGLDLDEQCETVMAECAPLLADVPSARLLDEVLKLFHHGAAFDTLKHLQHYGVFAQLFPDVDKLIQNDDPIAGPLVERALANTDSRVKADKPVIAPFLFAAVLWRTMSLVRQEFLDTGSDPRGALHDAADEILALQSMRVSIPRRIATPIREIWGFQDRLERGRNRQPGRLLEHKRFRAAYDFLLLRAEVGDADEELAQWWTKFEGGDNALRAEMATAFGGSNKSGKKKTGSRRRRRRRKKPANTEK